MQSDLIWNSLIEFIVRYEYARALFDKRAAVKFQENAAASELFNCLATTELNHAHRLQTFLNKTVVPRRETFFNHPEYGDYKGFQIDGISKRKIWTRFLFKGKSANQWSLEDSLAFCAAAERLESWGYKLLSLLPKFKNLASSISQEEANAEQRLVNLLLKTTSAKTAKRLILVWYCRAFLSMVILIVTRNK